MSFAKARILKKKIEFEQLIHSIVAIICLMRERIAMLLIFLFVYFKKPKIINNFILCMIKIWMELCSTKI